ncbi:hypothetical protein V7S43_007362 [Phytophthora oleae]|uniref:LNR domain-containing protein n=1 Tax=Phytophthora oleae TaxID=2107226 RepID=A0ABD3FQ58_9STRA
MVVLGTRWLAYTLRSFLHFQTHVVQHVSTASKMKFTSLITTIVAGKMLLVAAQSVDNSTSSVNSCSDPCEVFDEYCDVSTGECRGPSYDGECYNLATGVFQDGCNPSFQCIDNKCDYAQDTEADSNSEAGCAGTQCDVFGEYCDVNLNECRAPIDGECYNAVTSTFQHGCEQGSRLWHGLFNNFL